MSTDLPRDPNPAWFDDLYGRADRNSAAVPWVNLEPCPWVVEYLTSHPGPGTAVVVGCGLGDDAETLAAAGYDTTAFDVSPNAVDWCRERFPQSKVEYRVADLFDLSADLAGRFDLAVEVRTIQSLPPNQQKAALDAVASLVAPEGSVLLVALSRPDGTIPNGPPWALSASELKHFESIGMETTADYSDSGHFVLELSRNSGHE